MNLSFEEIVPRTPPLIELLVHELFFFFKYDQLNISVAETVKRTISTYHHLIDKLINGLFNWRVLFTN